MRETALLDCICAHYRFDPPSRLLESREDLLHVRYEQEDSKLNQFQCRYKHVSVVLRPVLLNKVTGHKR